MSIIIKQLYISGLGIENKNFFTFFYIVTEFLVGNFRALPRILRGKVKEKRESDEKEKLLKSVCG